MKQICIHSFSFFFLPRPSGAPSILRFCVEGFGPLFFFSAFSFSSSSIFSLSIKVIKVLHLLCSSIAVLDFRNQSNLNWGELQIHCHNSSYTFSVESKLVKHTDQKVVFLFSIVFSFVSTIRYSQLMKRCFVPSNLRVKCFFDTNSSLNSCLSSFNLSHNLFYVLQLIASFPEHSWVFNDFFWSFAFYFSCYILSLVYLSVGPFCFQDFGSSELSLFWILFQIDSLSPLLFGLVVFFFFIMFLYLLNISLPF